MSKVTVFNASGIKDEEDFTGFIVRQAELSSLDSYGGIATLLGSGTERAPFVHPPRIEAISALFPNVLPDWEQLVRRHTRYPLNSAFLTPEKRARLLQQHRYGGVRSAPHLTSVGAQVGRGRLGICLSCYESDLQQHGFAFWHRSHLTVSMFYCPTHAEPLITFCEQCDMSHRRSRKTWFPRSSCLCNRPMRRIAILRSRASTDAAIAIAKMADDVLKERIKTSEFAANTGAVLRAAIHRNASRRRDYRRLAREYVESRLGTELYSILGFAQTTILRATGIKTVDGPLQHPIQNIAAIWSLFDGWPAFLDEVNTRQADPKSYDESARPLPARIRVRGPDDSFERWTRQFEKMDPDEMERFREHCRSTILAAIASNPQFLRRHIAQLPNGKKLHFFAIRFDLQWFDRALPSQGSTSPSPIRRVRRQIRDLHVSALVLRRQKRTLRENPELFISRSFLLSETGSESSYVRGTRSPDLEMMLDQCADTFESWSRRQIQMVSTRAQEIDEQSKWASPETFEGLRPRYVRRRLIQARTWIEENSD